MEKIKILHLSDIHFGIKSTNKHQKRVTNSLIKAIKEHLVKRGAPDVCIISGDLTQSGAVIEFKEFETWLKKILKLASQCKVFIVPGNHEIERPADKTTSYIETGLRRSAYSKQENFDLYKKEFEDNHILIKNFISWHNDFSSNHPETVISKWCEKSITGCVGDALICDFNVKIIGLNTALLSCDDNDIGKLVADAEFLNESIDKMDTSQDLIIVVGHHPIGQQSNESWLVDWNSKYLEEILLASNGPHLYLHGHVHHTTGTTLSLTNGQGLSFFGAGACYQNTKYPMEFAFYDIEVDSQQITPFTYEFDSVNYKWSLKNRLNGSESIRAILPSSRINQGHVLNKQLSSLTEENQQLKKLLSTKPIQAHVVDFQYFCHISKDGSCKINENITIKALGGTVYFWKSFIDADEQADGMENYGNLEYKSNSEDKRVKKVVITDRPRFKEEASFFTPPLKDGETASLTKEYKWKRYIPHFFSDKAPVIFSWTFKSPDSKALGRFTLIFTFSEEIQMDLVKAKPVGAEYKNVDLKIDAINREIKYVIPGAKMSQKHTHGISIELSDSADNNQD